MKKEDLIHAVSYIGLEDERQENIILALQKHMQKSVPDRVGMKRSGNVKRIGNAGAKASAVVLGLVTMAGISLSAYALVASQSRERMEAMTSDTISELEEQVQAADVAADSFNRPYSDGEQERMEKLYAEYMGGRFPQGELLRVSSEAEAAACEQEDKICFLAVFSRFYLPLHREMTDEEILEVLDYMTKRDYALMASQASERNGDAIWEEADLTSGIESVEVTGSAAGVGSAEEAGSVAGTEAAETGSMVKLGQENTGQETKVVITEAEAIEIAAARAAELGLNLDGFELNHYFDGGDDSKDRFGGIARYGVNWSNIVSHTYYYFYISAEDGSVLEENYNGYAKYKEAAIQRNVQNGGISLEEAIAYARLRMEGAGLDPDAYHCSTWFTENHSEEFDGKSYYYVTWMDEENRKFYVFFLDGKDGTILEEYIN